MKKVPLSPEEKARAKMLNEKNPFLILNPHELDYKRNFTNGSRNTTRTPNSNCIKIDGTPEEMQDAYEAAMDYTYRILEYGDYDDISEEEAKFLRRYFYFLGKGPRRDYFYEYGVTKLTQADVFYILTVTTSATHIAKRFNIHPDTVRQLRAGNLKEWFPEYCLVKRLKMRMYRKLRGVGDNQVSRRVPALYERKPDGKDQVLFLFTTLRKAKQFREEYLGVVRTRELEKKNLLDIAYPVRYEEVYR